MSDYFWKYKHEVLLEATGHTPEEIKQIRFELLGEAENECIK